jgi:hypothetical protein
MGHHYALPAAVPVLQRLIPPIAVKRCARCVSCRMNRAMFY